MDRDRSWMYNRLETDGLLRIEFAYELLKFLDHSFSDRGKHSGGLIQCPCVGCKNLKHFDYDTVGIHLMRHGFLPNYYVWDCHGELRNFNGGSSSSGAAGPVEGENFRNLLFDSFSEFREYATNGVLPEEPNCEAKDFYDLMNATDRELYEGNDESLLQWVSELLSHKALHNESIAGMDNIIRIAKKSAPVAERDKIPDNFNTVKKVMMKLGLGHVTFDVCEDNCFLFYEEGSQLRECPVCHKSRYEDKKNLNGKDVAKKKLWYLPITPRLQRLYMARKTAEHMIWHTNCKDVSDKIIHPAGGEAWKHFDRTYPTFAAEDRNVRLGLCTDGFNPFNHSAKPYSCWPVFLTPYNLPPGLCMKQEFIFLSLIISGPKSPGENIDVLLRPLIDEMKMLWNGGALTYDIFKQQNFTMRAIILWTISDFPAYGMLSGWSTHGKLACPYCMENVKSFWLKHGHKSCWFDCHRQFLPMDHPFRQNTSDFYKDRVVMDHYEERRLGPELFELVNQLPDCPKSHGYGVTHHWTRKSKLWELPYWSTLLIRHNLDPMHYEKNSLDNIKGTEAKQKIMMLLGGILHYTQKERNCF